MFTAAPWTAFAALVAMEILVVLVVRVGLSLTATARHHHSTSVHLD